jgi:murein DD-endopeptidase MepM/ murein hydrolase activator NlpD
MVSRRFTIVAADRTTGVVRRFSLSLRPTLLGVVGLFSVPVLIGLGARWSAQAELQHLRASNAVLREENASFRAATGQLTDQIVSLQSAIAELGVQGSLDPATHAAVASLPALVRGSALGGARDDHTRAVLAAATRSPEDTFGVLRDMLGVLERRLSVVKVDLQYRSEVAKATPSIWPSLGWLTSGFGLRRDPFTGRPASHFGLDISADRGDLVRATADGIVETASRIGDYGNLVTLSHGFGLSTRYAHLSRILVTPGMKVKRGDIVGYVGSTGRSTSSHLHYEVWADGRPVNPIRLLVGKPDER